MFSKIKWVFLFAMLVSCANKEIELGKKCFIKGNGDITWSYIWIKDKGVVLNECPKS